MKKINIEKKKKKKKKKKKLILKKKKKTEKLRLAENYVIYNGNEGKKASNLSQVL